MTIGLPGKRAHDRTLKVLTFELEKILTDLDRLNAPADIAAHLTAGLERLREITG